MQAAGLGGEATCILGRHALVSPCCINPERHLLKPTGCPPHRRNLFRRGGGVRSARAARIARFVLAWREERREAWSIRETTLETRARTALAVRPLSWRDRLSGL